MDTKTTQQSYKELSTLYSHAFLVGEVEYKPTLEKELEKKTEWKREIVNKEMYSEYYEGHLMSMLEVEGKESPDFLKSCRHYTYTYIGKTKSETDTKLTLEYLDRLKQTHKINNYQFKFCRLHLYFLPLQTLILALEIDDTGSNINDLTLAHSILMAWDWDSFTPKTQNELKKELDPLNFILSNNWDRINNTGAKMKIFQFVEMPIPKIDDGLLYEIGTSTPIGSVNCESHWLKPSKSYFESIMRDNSISAFDNWKALALNDSLTCLGLRNGVNDYKWINFYFPLIYLRAYFEKHFCFEHNIRYRRDNESKNLIQEMAYMEKYYFYDNISYNFLPNLIYEKVKLGLGIDMERRELTEQIKNDEQKQENILMEAVAIFAIVSIMNDGASLISQVYNWCDSGVVTFIIICVILIFIFALVRWLFLKRYIFKYTRFGRFFLNIYNKILRKK